MPYNDEILIPVFEVPGLLLRLHVYCFTPLNYGAFKTAVLHFNKLI